MAICRAGTFPKLSTDYGATFTSVLSTITNQIQWVGMSYSGQYMTAGKSTASNSVYISSNYGSSWTNLNLPSSGGSVLNISMDNTGQYQWILTNSANKIGLFKSINYGSSWSKISSSDFPSDISASYEMQSIAVSGNNNYVWVGCYVGSVFVSTNGTSFTNISGTRGLPAASNPAWVCASNTGQYVTVTYRSVGSYYSSNYGSSFTKSNLGVYDWQFCAMSQGGKYQITTTDPSNSNLWYSINYGVSWSRAPTGQVPDAQYMGCAMDADAHYILIGSWASPGALLSTSS
jgi:photosystem II stability/assembly factor-like uncharacterized protein